LRVLRQVIEQRRSLIEEQRQVVLDTGGRDAAAQVLEDRAAPEVDIEALAESRLEAGDRIFLQRKLSRRQQLDRFDLVDGALVFRVEGAQGFDFVVEQVDAIGQFAAHREQVDQRSAYGELAVLVNRIDVAIAAGFQARAHLFDIELLPDIQHQAAAEQKFGRRQAMQGGGDRHHQHAVRQFRQPIKTGDALGNDVLVRREQIVRQGFPVGEMQHGQIRGEETQLLFQPFGTLAVGGQ